MRTANSYSPPRLVFVTGLEVAGGAESMVVALYKYFVENFQHWDTSLIVLLRGGESPNLRSLDSGSVVRLEKARTIQAAYAMMKVLIELRPTAIVSSLPHVSSLLEIAILITGSKAKHYARIEGKFRPNPGKGLLSSIRSRLTISLLRRAHHFIVVSEKLSHDTLEVLGRQKDSATIIPNAIVPSQKLRQTRVAAASDSKTVRLLVVGRLSPEKNQILALEVLSDLVKQRQYIFEMHFFGCGSDEAFLKRETIRRSLHNQVFFHGFVEDRSEIYGYGDILLVTSLHEGQPLSIIEALSFGLPVVSVDCDYGPREILVEKWMGSLSDPTPEALAKNILFHARKPAAPDDALRRQRYAETQHSLELVAKRHNLLLRGSLVSVDK